MKPKHEIPWRRHKDLAEKNRQAKAIAEFNFSKQSIEIEQMQRMQNALSCQTGQANAGLGSVANHWWNRY